MGTGSVSEPWAYHPSSVRGDGSFVLGRRRRGPQLGRMSTFPSVARCAGTPWRRAPRANKPRWEVVLPGWLLSRLQIRSSEVLSQAAPNSHQRGECTAPAGPVDRLGSLVKAIGKDALVWARRPLARRPVQAPSPLSTEELRRQCSLPVLGLPPLLGLLPAERPRARLPPAVAGGNRERDIARARSTAVPV